MSQWAKPDGGAASALINYCCSEAPESQETMMFKFLYTDSKTESVLLNMLNMLYMILSVLSSQIKTNK